MLVRHACDVMLRAPPRYDEKFYEGEIEGQKRRLARLKERLKARIEERESGF